jgi:resuscitation-promoting factor RpfA
MDKSPDAFRTISEVSEWLDTPTHVLRFWESRFHAGEAGQARRRAALLPSGGHALLGGIKKLLHEDGLTIRGVQKILREEGVRYVASGPHRLPRPSLVPCRRRPQRGRPHGRVRDAPDRPRTVTARCWRRAASTSCR